MEPIKQNLTIRQGATFEWPFYWYSDTEVVKNITAVSLTYPAVLTVVGHGLPASPVPATILNVGDWLDSPSLELRDRLYVTKVATDTVSVKVDGTGEDAYTGSAGRLVYNAPMDLSSGWTARMQIRETVDSTTVIEEFTSAAGDITLGADGLVEITLSATAADALTVESAVYDLELVNTATGKVYPIANGKVTLKLQVTR